MKRKITAFALFTLLFVTTSSVRGETLTVTSNADSGEGSLRELIAIAESGDKILIPDGFIITLNSEITLEDRHLAIDGQGSTIQVAEPGVSSWRLFNLASNGTENRNLTFENLTLLGGDVSASGSGGAIFISKRVYLTMKNCVVKNGKAQNGGAVCIGATEKIEEFLLEDCVFENNTGTASGGVGAVTLKGINARVNNCRFEGNASASSTSALYLDFANATEPATTLSGCYFAGNSSSGTGDSSASVYFKGGTYTLNVDNCTFDGNEGKGSIFFSSSSTKVVFTNSTFYNNNCGINGRGIIYMKSANAKELIAVNCTFAGNTSIRSSHGSVLTASDATTAVTLVNNIFAYNYGNSDFYDTHLAASPEGTHNIVNGNKSSVLLNPVLFTHDENPLFASYTTNSDGKKIPELDNDTKTIPLLAGTSVAIAAGVAAYGDPSLVPAKDQCGETRATTPCIGSFEYLATTGMSILTATDKLEYSSADGNLTIMANIAQKMNLYSLDGRLVVTMQLNKGSNTISGLTKGFYLLNNQKIIIK